MPRRHAMLVWAALNYLSRDMLKYVAVQYGVNVIV